MPNKRKRFDGNVGSIYVDPDLRLEIQADKPALPNADEYSLYAKADSVYYMDSSGNETPLLGGAFPPAGTLQSTYDTSGSGLTSVSNSTKPIQYQATDAAGSVVEVLNVAGVSTASISGTGDIQASSVLATTGSFPTLTGTTGTFAGNITSASSNVTNNITAGSATVLGALAAGVTTITGGLTSDVVTITNGLTSGTADILGALTADSATITNGVTAQDLTVNTITGSGGGGGGGGGGTPDVDIINEDYTVAATTAGTLFGETVGGASPDGQQLSIGNPNLGGGIVFLGALPQTVTIEFDWLFKNASGRDGAGNAMAFFTSDKLTYDANFKWYQNSATGVNYGYTAYAPPSAQIRANEIPFITALTTGTVVDSQVYSSKIIITETSVEMLLDGVSVLTSPKSALTLRTHFGITGHGSTFNACDYYVKNLRVYVPGTPAPPGGSGLTITTDTTIEGVISLEEQTVDPGDPDAGNQLLYSKPDGHLYYKNSTEERKIADYNTPAAVSLQEAYDRGNTIDTSGGPEVVIKDLTVTSTLSTPNVLPEVTDVSTVGSSSKRYLEVNSISVNAASITSTLVETDTTSLNQLAATPAPKPNEVNRLLLYGKGDKRLYYRDDTGLERKITDDAIAGGLTTLQEGFDNGTGVINTTTVKPLVVNLPGTGGQTVMTINANNGPKLTFDGTGKITAVSGEFKSALETNTVTPTVGTANVGAFSSPFNTVFSNTVRTSTVNYTNHILPVDNAVDLGSTGSRFKELFLVNTTLGANVLPNITNTVDLGTTTQRFKDAYLSGNLTASGAVSTGAVTASGLVQAGSTLTNGSSTVLGNLTVNGSITYNGAITGSKAYCEAYWINGTLSMFNNLVPANTWSIINGPVFPNSFNNWVPGTLINDFTIGTVANPFGFKYDGTPDKIFNVSVNIGWESEGKREPVELCIGKNGSQKPSTITQCVLDDTGNYPRSTSTCGLFSLATDDYIEVFARTTESNDQITIHSANITISEL